MQNSSYAIDCEKELLDNTRQQIKLPISLAYIFYANTKEYGISIRGIQENKLFSVSDSLSTYTGFLFRVVNKHIILKKNIKKKDLKKKDLPDKQILTEKLKQYGYAVQNKDLYYKEYEDKFYC